jgi:conjugative relaxase-like TrwC/TraI family protein
VTAGEKGTARVISIRRISIGGGFRYLMESVAAGDGAGAGSSSLTAYYAESGTPPGVFLGGGLADLDGGRGVEPGSQVTEEHLRNMLAICADPVSGEPVGSAPRAPAGAMSVAGFDMTFSPSKSVSVAWALADEQTRDVIYSCHRQAIEYVLAYGEGEVFHSRSGTNGIVEEDVTGVVAASFTHFTSRADDPQLHSHAVIWNRAKSVSDHKWRTLDSRAIFKATTTLSELHQGVLSDLLTSALGVGWEARGRRHSHKARYEITGVPESLMAEFSQRSEQIAAQSEILRAEFTAAHGRSATAVEDMRLYQQATISTRPNKTKHSLRELTTQWRVRTSSHVAGHEQMAWVKSLKDRNDLPLLSSDDLGEAILADAAEAVVVTVAERHATYGRQNLLAEAHRMLHGVRFVSPDDRVAVAGRITELAFARSVSLTPPQLHHVPERYRRLDGSSRLSPSSRVRYTTTNILEAEERLLDAARQLAGARVSTAVVAEVAEQNLPGRDYGLSTDQAFAVEKMATSGRVLDLLLGPAGSGKSTAMAGLRAVWEASHGKGSVIGLAPSAVAAQVLSDELGIETENTAKWLTEWRRIPELTARRDRLAANLARHAHPKSAVAAKLRARLKAVEQDIAQRRLQPGQLVILDEASLAGTFALDEIVGAARLSGAKVLCLGDFAQLSAVEAGGAFSLLVNDRDGLVPELTEVRRFMADWEKDASVGLRLGKESAVDAYEAHGRIAAGDRASLLDSLYKAWKADVDAGRSSLMIAGDTATVSELNERARSARVTEGTVAETGLRIANGQTAGAGDEVVTRQNNRMLTVGKGWVKNGDRFVVVATNPDGTMTLRRSSGGAEVVLPADYVADHVELGYATTAYRAQGRTLDTAHAMVSPSTTREVLYVCATRGRESNRIFVDTSYDPDPATSHDGLTAPQSAREVLTRVLANEGADLSAHETLRREQRRTEDFSVLAAEYETLAAVAQQQRWDDLLDRSGIGAHHLEHLRRSDAYGPLLAALRDAESGGLDVNETLPKLVAARSLAGAEDPASVLHGRVQRWAHAAGPRRRGGSNLVAGLIPRAAGVTDTDMARALVERDRAMERRARESAELAIERGEPWVRRLGPAPNEPTARQQWMRAVSTVAAYRDRWAVADDRLPLGPDRAVKGIEETRQRTRAEGAVRRAVGLSREARVSPPEVGGVDTGIAIARAIDL